VARALVRTAALADLERADGWAPIRRSLGIESFGVNAWSAHEAGATIVIEHDEEPSGHEELYVVIRGRARFSVEGEELDAPAGTVVFVPDPSLKRGAVALEPDTTILTVGGKPGEAYAPLSWETNRDVIALLGAGRNAEAKRLLLDALDDYADRSYLLYNLACAEAQLGEADAAFAHLRDAVKLRPSLAAHVAADADLEPLRDDPRLPEIIAAG
jgi:hypothetical protein